MVNYRKLALGSLLAGLAVLLVLAIALPIGFRQYLHSEAFRRRIGEAAGRALQADAEFVAPSLTGSTAYTEGFTARGQPGAAFQRLLAEQIRADFNWRGLLHHRWQIDELAVERLEVQLTDAAASAAPRPPDAETAPATTGAKAGPAWQLDLRQATVRDSRWRWGGGETPAGELAQAPLRVTPQGEAWLIELSGGRLRQSGWPEIAVESAHLRAQKETLFITDSLLRQGRGAAHVTGEIAFDREVNLQVALEGMEVTPLLSGDWRTRIRGQIYGDGTVRAPLRRESKGGPVISGSARLVGGQLTALPILDEIAAFTKTQRFRTVELTTASLDFSQEGERFTGRHLLVEAEGLLRVEGDFVLREGQIDGNFQVGVTAASLQWLPGSQARVFTEARGGYFWAPLRLTGPADHPTEDLSPKLAQAAAGEVLQTAGAAAQEATKAVRETAKDLLDRLLR